MKYSITHTTRYSYSEPVPVCQNLVRLVPRDGLTQRCEKSQLVINPSPAEKRSFRDYFGNRVDYFSINEAHSGLLVTATSRLEVIPLPVVSPHQSPNWEQVAVELQSRVSRENLDANPFVFSSPHIPAVRFLADYAQVSFAPGRPILDAAIDLTSRVHSDITYDDRATTVSTPLEEVFEIRRGVCQDLAHVQIGCLRSLGLAARYVSGYLRTIPPPGQARLIGADASHAWVSLYCGHLGWIDFDPTNNVIPSSDHITLAWGRDYSDVCPIKGVFVGGGQHHMSVSVDVLPQE